MILARDLIADPKRTYTVQKYSGTNLFQSQTKRINSKTKGESRTCHMFLLRLFLIRKYFLDIQKCVAKISSHCQQMGESVSTIAAFGRNQEMELIEKKNLHVT